MQYGIYILTLLERIDSIWLKMSVSEKRIISKFLYDKEYYKIEVFLTILERHDGSMEYA